MQLPHLLLIDKPAGITSFDVIRQLRKRTGKHKMGHAGTLDPAATGLLLLGYDEGTKQLNDFLKLDKEYLAEILLGVATTSGDLEGEITEQATVEELEETTVETIVSDLTGTHTLPVSAYSAIKQDGVPLYKRARQAAAAGEELPERPLREMTVHEAAFLGLRREGKQAIVTVRFHVGSGTYIRSLAEEVGKHLGYPAVLKSLRRTRIGVFDVEHAQKIEEVDATQLS